MRQAVHVLLLGGGSSSHQARSLDPRDVVPRTQRRRADWASSEPIAATRTENLRSDLRSSFRPHHLYRLEE